MQASWNPNQYWLIKTNQVWKFLIFSFLMFLGMTSFFAMIMVINEIWKFEKVNDIHLSIGSVMLIFGSLVWLSQSIKCPHCGYKPVWPILRSAPASEWLARIVKLKECPSCSKK